jgi:hypothetical protein
MTVPRIAEPDTAFCERFVLIFKECSLYFAQVKVFYALRVRDKITVLPMLLIMSGALR